MQNEMVIEQVMTVQDVAEFLKVTDKTIYRMLTKGELPGFKVSGSWRFQRFDIQGWIEDQKKANLTH